MLKRNVSPVGNKPRKSYGARLAEREFAAPKVTSRKLAAHNAVNRKFIREILFAYPGQHD
jgi:hypothetical protein